MPQFALPEKKNLAPGGDTVQSAFVAKLPNRHVRTCIVQYKDVLARMQGSTTWFKQVEDNLRRLGSKPGFFDQASEEYKETCQGDLQTGRLAGALLRDFPALAVPSF
jgi:hypothetical protein